ncbi:MAG: PAS domain S-box protein [Clostridia bacterium]|nr:PAS domain S-box protein [Clostridia bacterium]
MNEISTIILLIGASCGFLLLNLTFFCVREKKCIQEAPFLTCGDIAEQGVINENYGASCCITCPLAKKNCIMYKPFYNYGSWGLIFRKIVRAVIRSENLSCIAIDSYGKISLVSPGAKKIFKKAIRGKGYGEVFPKASVLNSLIRNALQEGKSFYKEIVINIEGKNYFLQVFFEAVKDWKGTPAGAVLFFKDITKEKEQELADREEERLTAIKQLAAGVAHEMRQPLTVVKGFAQLIQKDVGDSIKLNSFCQIIIKEMDRMNGIISNFLELANPCVLSTEKVSLNKIVQESAEEIRDRCKERNIKIKFKLAKFLPEIKADKAKLKRALMHILDNALDAMEEKNGGVLTFTTGLERDGVFLSVSDTGFGIPEDRISKTAEPFFSTKKEGTGLGLSVAKSIVEHHNGEMEIQSKLGRGTTVKLRFSLDFCWFQNYLLVEDL